jgi:hypothetical protein
MGAELRQEGLLVGRTNAEQQADLELRAAVRIADQVAAEHPDLTVAELVNDPAIVAGLRELLAVIGLRKPT